MRLSAWLHGCLAAATHLFVFTGCFAVAGVKCEELLPSAERIPSVQIDISMPTSSGMCAWSRWTDFEGSLRWSRRCIGREAFWRLDLPMPANDERNDVLTR